MSNPQRILTRCRGLNNFADPSQVILDFEKGEYELTEAVNVVIRNGRVSRRKGRTQVVDQGYHSLFAVSDFMIGVTGDALSIIDRDYSLTNLRNVNPTAKMSYARSGSRVYYANGYETGYVDLNDRLSHGWTFSEYVGPTTQRTFSSPPVGTILCIFKGRMYIATGQYLWYSEPFAFNQFDMARNFLDLGSPIVMVGASEDTLFVSNEEAVLSHFGNSPQDFQQKPAFDFPAIKGTMCEISLTKYPLIQGVLGQGIIWVGSKGICVGGNRGANTLLCDRKLKLPDVYEGNAVMYDGNYIVNLVN